LTVFKNISAIKAKPSVGSLLLMLNLLWDDRHLCHIKKMEKTNTGTLDGYIPQEQKTVNNSLMILNS
jgi:hypothetical protein